MASMTENVSLILLQLIVGQSTVGDILNSMDDVNTKLQSLIDVLDVHGGQLDSLINFMNETSTNTSSIVVNSGDTVAKLDTANVWLEEIKENTDTV